MGFTSSTTKYSLTGSSSSTFSDYKTLGFSFNPNVSYFFAKQLSIGLALPYSTNKSSSSGSPDTKVSSISVGPMIRYYFPFNKMAVFPELQYTFGQQTTTGPVFSPQTGTVTVETIKSKLNMLRTGVGVTYFLNSSIGVEGLLYYLKSENKYDDGSQLSSSVSQFGINFGFQIYFK